MNIRSRDHTGQPSPREDHPRVALITGASRGLGATLARLFSPMDYSLVLDARDGEALEETARRLSTYGSQVIAVPGDVADPAHRRALATAVAGFGRLDLLVNNASELGPSPLPPLAEISPDSLLRVFSVNLFAPLLLTQALLLQLKAARGLIVNISSDAALGGYPGWGAYGSSKAALDLASVTLASELREDGIAVVSVDPGDLRTAMHQRAFPGEDITDRPLPDVTIPFWLWLLGQDPQTISGRRFKAQAERWEVAHEPE